MTTLQQLEHTDAFVARHIGPSDADVSAMLAVLGLDSLDQLTTQTVPADILRADPLPLPGAIPEHVALAELAGIAGKNVLARSFIGLGYHPTLTPNVILRNVTENPGWYTAYTPYQAEIAQGRLEALLNFQQMVIDMTGLELANASLLDEATAAAEAMAMARRVSKARGQVFFVDSQVLPQTFDVLKTRAAEFGFELVSGHPEEAVNHELFGALFQYPGADGEVSDLSTYIAAAQQKGAIVTVAADILALALLKSPGEMGADIAVGTTQRFGIPMGFGGPHAAYFASRDAHKRSTPGRLIGVSIDARGKRALRMALQTREQHIRREKANSNICTSQVLLANMAGFFATYHGPAGIKRIAARVHRLACLFADGVRASGGHVASQTFFDTVRVQTGAATESVLATARAAGYNLRRVDAGTVAVAFHEVATGADVVELVRFITGKTVDVAALDARVADQFPAALKRESAYLTHPVFNSHHSETEMMRYLKKLQNRDLALDHAMIPLGSCTMKLNAASEMTPITWPAFGGVHPFAPRDQVQGYLELVEGLSEQLKAITGFDAISLQPNSGAQGEYAGLLCIRRYLDSKGQQARKICLIPTSAHGTNPASAQMMGMEVVPVACDDNGNIDVADLKAKAEQYRDTLACLMLTYPSTHGVFEAAIRDIIDTVHAHGGQVYFDGANLNALVGLVRPADIGADVSHMNLHKTFCIPHGGGGPGVGPIGMKAHLAPFAPNHAVTPIANGSEGQSAVSAAPFGSASILPISWMYIRMMGGAGLRRATQVALLSANYVARRLEGAYPILYRDANGRVAHECIVDLRPLKAETGITEVDVAKRLMDYGFHAPTMSFPVAGTIMIEPTESESRAELERFIDALLAIREEIRKVGDGEWPRDDNPLKHAPHSIADVTGEWTRPYPREQGLFPLPYVAENKFWPFVNRIDDVYGDRNLVCSCPPMSEYQ
ncbi:aminomethyl-transferring glycine dehydrogenase [Microvirgula aerodenitrificans]|uniref:aminomethyl-transferring glycine dehydrogenase n=1 Tax=Microvirgula aerodenitrificans TaxID=57480 RepID=UPI00248EEB00|nr:aminomethyl-transferring glycine dehydrogenase [Microvirgula aerodenitrificans]